MPKEKFKVRNCKTAVEKVFEFNAGVILPNNAPCGCSTGFNLNPSTLYCEQVLTTSATSNVVPTPFQRANTSAQYGSNGVVFYENIDNKVMPLKDNPNNIEDAVPSALVKQTAGGFWRNNSGSDGRLNDVGIFAPPTVIVDEWFGFTKCFDVDTEAEYNFGIGGWHEVRMRLNGEEIIWLQDRDFACEQWHVIPITLKAGVNIIEVEGKEPSTGDGSIGFELYKENQAGVMGWTNLSELNDALVFSSLEFDGTDVFTGFNGWTCPTGYAVDYCNGGDFPVCTWIRREDANPCTYGVVKVNEYPCDCWEVLYPVDLLTSSQPVILDTSHDNCPSCLATLGDCDRHERDVSYAQIIKLPEPIIPNKGFKECCYDNLVLAHLTDSSDYKNDYNSFYFKRQQSFDTCDFILHDVQTSATYALNSATYGQFWDFGGFGTQPDLKVIRVDWRKVLAVLGAGMYQIEKDMIIAGLPFSQMSNTYHLEHFSTDLANHTVRIDSVMNGKLVELDIDFKGTNFSDSLRMKGFFGRREPEYTQDNIVKRNYKSEQISMSQENKYQFQTRLLPVCITDYLFDFLIFGNELYTNDYNLINHSYKFIKFAVELEDNKGTGYYATNRDARVNLVFTDRKKDKRKLNC